MKHIIGIGVKFILITTVVLSIFAVLSTNFVEEMLFLSIVIVLLSYVLGDLFIVPKFGNLVGTVADFGLSLVILVGYGLMTMNTSFVFLMASIFSAFLIAVGEAFFHYYVQQVITDERKDIYEEPKIIHSQLNSKLQTEMAEEEDIYDLKKTKK